ncbi:MAG: heavy-metal-associated domain-containing protein [Candidatus Methanoperedens sp.]|nr:heavy-metal-associated domain-containing protein [Candidatus Methanoperedens sp.]MCE8428987.1 heavy-metal-associated domain-containing protein [Candidatus Methanoperedens sp.]
MKKVTFDIAGMRCGACAVGLELMLAKKKGIKSAKVSLNERMAVVEYDPAIVALSDISKAASDLGYIATATS